MKYIKKFDNNTYLSEYGLPKQGQYIFVHVNYKLNENIKVREFINSNIGEVIYSDAIIADRVTNGITVTVVYENIPKDISKHFIFDSYQFYFSFLFSYETDYYLFADTKDELHAKIEMNKYNL